MWGVKVHASSDGQDTTHMQLKENDLNDHRHDLPWKAALSWKDVADAELFIAVHVLRSRCLSIAHCLWFSGMNWQSLRFSMLSWSPMCAFRFTGRSCCTLLRVSSRVQASQALQSLAGLGAVTGACHAVTANAFELWEPNLQSCFQL